MKAFVTGGTGMLGNNLVRTLVAHGWEVRALARSAEKARRVLAGVDVQVVEGDLADPGPWASHLRGMDVVFHTAAMFREYDGADPDAWAALARTNVDGTLALAAAATDHGVARFVDTSTGGLIGRAADGGPGDETAPPPPIAHTNLYMRSKLETLDRLHTVGRERGLAVISIHPGWMFGPWDAAPTAAGQLVRDFLAGALPAVPAGGSCVVDARDVAFGMMRAAERGEPGSRWVIGGRYADLRQIVDILAKVTGRPAPRWSLPGPVALGFAWCAETFARLTGRPTLITVMGMRTMQARLSMRSTRAEDTLGVRFRPLEETLADTARWMGEAA